VAPDTDAVVRKNIAELAPAIWGSCKSEPKYKLGIVLEGYRSNLDQARYDLGQEFFEVVAGNAFRSEGERSLILSEAINDLYSKHVGWDNFHHEPPVARRIASFVPDQAAIPASVAESLFMTVLTCRIGRGINYNQGVSPGARPSYDHILSQAGDQHVGLVFKALRHFSVQSRLSSAIARAQAKLALVEVRKNVINARLIECLDYLIVKIEGNAKAPLSKEFEELAAAYYS
jgi:hypothetical protein